MTRQKKEIIKKLDEIDNIIAAETELGCGFTPSSFYEEMEEIKFPLLAELARLSHYDSVDEMLYDDRGFTADPELPF